jgi:hypothetical protein
MKNIFIKICLTILVLLGTVNFSVASDLANCPSNQSVRWDNCVGTKKISGETYTGEWKDNLMSGQGTLGDPNGPSYVGQFKAGKIHGQGRLTFTNVSVAYVGQFKDNMINGQGTLTMPDGTVKEGIFKNNEFQYPNRVAPSVSNANKSAKEKSTSSKPVITNYTGRLVADKYRHQVGKFSWNCPQGVIQFTTINWPQKGQISAAMTYGGGSSTLRGRLDQDSNIFKGFLKQTEYRTLHLNGVVKEDSVEGSLWFEIHNYPSLNSNGLCIVNFTAYPTR